MSNLDIRGLQEAQQRNLRRIAQLEPDGALGTAIQWGTTEAHRRLTYNTPFDTGSLRASRRIVLNLSALRGQIFTSRNARNPRSNIPPAEYDELLHTRGFRPGRRGGILASMPYTVVTDGPHIARGMAGILRKGLRNP